MATTSFLKYRSGGTKNAWTTSQAAGVMSNDDIDTNFATLNLNKLEAGDPSLSSVTANGSSTNTNLTLLGTTNYIKKLEGYTGTHLQITGAAAASQQAYDVRLTGGSVISGNGVGGGVSLAGGNANGNAAGGFIDINGGVGGTDREGGQVTIRGGYYGPSSGSSSSAGRGGDVIIAGGYGGQSNGTGGARGGHVYIKPGVGGVATPASTYIYAPTAGAANVNNGSGSESIVAEFNSSTIKLQSSLITLGNQFSSEVEFYTAPYGTNASAASAGIAIVTGDGYLTTGRIFISPGLTVKANGTAKGAPVYLIAGGVETTNVSSWDRTGGNVYIDGGKGQRYSGSETGWGGTIYIGTTPNDTGLDSLIEAGTRYINIGHNGANPLGGMGVNVASSTTTISGQCDFGSTGSVNLFGTTTIAYGGRLFIGSNTGTAGFINYDAYDEISFGYGASYDGAVAQYKVRAADAYATRMTSGLNSGYSNNSTFRFQRANSKTYGANITWVDQFTISNAGLAYASGGLASGQNITAAGDIIAFYASDKRLKTNIVRIDSALEKVNSLDGVTFNWNETAKEKFEKDLDVREAGVIAQQVQAVLPEVVKTREDGTLAVKYEQMVPLLIEAIKELTSQVKDLQNQLMNK